MGSCTYTFDPATDADSDFGDGPAGPASDDVADSWACPHSPHPDADRCLFHLDPAERDSLDVDRDDLTDRFLALFDEQDPERRRVLGADLPTIHVEYEHLVGESRHPVDLRWSDVDGLEFDHTTVEAPMDFRGARIGTLDLTEAEFDKPLSFSGTAFDGRVAAVEAEFAEEVTFDGARFGDEVSFAGTEFDDEIVFENAIFEGPATFDGGQFHGRSSVRDDRTSFAGAEFRDRAAFEEARFESVDVDGATFRAEADFQSASFDGTAAFTAVTFEALADFDEARFRADATFRGSAFHATADFRGAEFVGGANVLADDADFEEVAFDGPARFGKAEFRFADFQGAAFADEAAFQEAIFDEDVDFSGVTFEALADFDEARFNADGDFTDVTFEGEAHFRGVTFYGDARHLEDNARFEGAAFHGAATFEDAIFTSANFREVTFDESATFRGVEFRDDLHMAAESARDTVLVDMTDADVERGTIAQPADHWVRYDFTRARLGDVSLSGDDGTHRLFDYFRFLETDFDGFDFSAHRTYLDRNGWDLHTFDEADRGGTDAGGADAETSSALPATPEHVETTYLYAYNNAKAMGDNDAAIEFAIHQAKHRREKNVGAVFDSTQSAGYRLGKAGDVVGNTLWHLTCGYGYRLWRILVVSVFVVVTWGVLYALPFTRLDNEASLQSVGTLFSIEGVSTVAQYVYYSLITFTTVGYGDINPVNAAARTLAVAEGILGILLAALVVFVLGRRVAV